MLNAPRLAQAIADELEVGVGQLRDLGSEGRITSETVFNALVNQSAAIATEAENIATTTGGALTVLTNNVQLFVSELDSAVGFTQALNSGILALGSQFGQLASIVRPVIELIRA